MKLSLIKQNPISLVFFAALFVIMALLITQFSLGFLVFIILGLGLAILSIYKIEYGILALAIYIPFEPFLLKFVSNDIYPYDRFAGEELLLILLFVVILKRLIKKDFKLIKTPIDLPFILFILVALVSMIWNFNPLHIGLLGLRQTLRFIILFYAAVYAGLKKETIKKIIWILLVVVLFEVLIGLGQVVVGEGASDFLMSQPRKVFGLESTEVGGEFYASGQRIFATLGRYDKFGTFLCFFILISLGLAYELRKSRIFKFLLGLILLSIPTLILSYSRMSWIGFALGLGLISIWIKKDKRVLIGFVSLIIFLSSYFLFTNIRISKIENRPKMTIQERFLEMFSPQHIKWSYQGKGRLYFIIQTPIKVVRHSPIFGVGPGMYGGGVVTALHNTEVYDKLGLPFGAEGVRGEIDNSWFSIWGEYGTLGLILFLWIIISLFKYTLNIYRKSRDRFTRGLALGYLGAIGAVSLQSFLGPYFEVRTLVLYFWLIGGLIVSLGIKETLNNN